MIVCVIYIWMDGWMDGWITKSMVLTSMRTLQLDHSHKLLCEVGACLLNKAMRQVLLRPTRGSPYRDK